MVFTTLVFFAPTPRMLIFLFFIYFFLNWHSPPKSLYSSTAFDQKCPSTCCLSLVSAKAIPVREKKQSSKSNLKKEGFTSTLPTALPKASEQLEKILTRKAVQVQNPQLPPLNLNSYFLHTKSTQSVLASWRERKYRVGAALCSYRGNPIKR